MRFWSPPRFWNPIGSPAIAALACLLGGALSGAAFVEPAWADDDGDNSAASDSTSDTPEGRWRPLREPDAGLSDEQRAGLEKLRSIGYLGGVTRESRAGVTAYSPDHALQGANFYTSGHDAEAVLMDMEGEVLHRWRYSFNDAWPDSPDHRRIGAGWWRRARLLPNGDVIAIFEGLGLIRVDLNSELVWKSAISAHHDIHVLPDGDILALTREPRVIPEIHETKFTLEDFLCVIDAGGRVKERFSVFEAFANSEYMDYIGRGRSPRGDVFHTNSLHVLSGDLEDRLPEFKRGRILTSMNALGVIAVWDLEENRLAWARKSEPTGQHDPRALPNGNLLFFDNYRNADSSAVIEIDPRTDEIQWEYRGSRMAPFTSPTCGAADRLPNGNTLITESDGGRAFEVNVDGQIVWEFFNPERSGEDDEYIATISEMTRIPWEQIDAWLP